jgi:phosphoglycolate phosphatase
MPAIKLIIFDLDGTLVDAYKAVADSVNNALASCGHAPVDEESIKRSVGWGEKALIEKLTGGVDAERVLSVYRVHHRTALKAGTKFLPGARQLIGELKSKGYRLAIASNRPSYFTQIILRHLAINRHFASVVCADDVPNPKPSADMLEAILRRLSLAKGEALYVGDMALDVQTGKRAGMVTVSVVTGSSSRQEIEREGPDFVIENIGLLRGVLDTLENEKKIG